MNIQFWPLDKNGKEDKDWPAKKTVGTMVGEFRKGEVVTLQPHQEKEGRRLIENGDFREVQDAAAAPAAKAAPEVVEQDSIEEQVADSKKSKK
jgi:hypothetical protein